MGNKSGLNNPTFLLVSVLLCLILTFGTIAIASFPTPAAYAFIIAEFGGFDLLRYLVIGIVGAVLVIALLSYIGYPVFSKGKLNSSILFAIMIIFTTLFVGLSTLQIIQKLGEHHVILRPPSRPT